MIAGYVNRLAPDGMIITSGAGLRFGWPGYTPGVSIDEAARNWRVLGDEGLEQLSERYHLKLDRCFVPGIVHGHGQKDETGEPQIADETLWLLSKGSMTPPVSGFDHGIHSGHAPLLDYAFFGATD
jgi:hypothetical protein